MPGDPNIQRTLDALTTLVERPGGWPDEAIQKVAADAKHVIYSLDELGPDTAIEQGISRLAMISFLSGAAGPWGATASIDSALGDTVRYRGHAITRRATLDWLEVHVVHVGHDGKTAETVLRTQDWENDYADDWALSALSNLDQLLDAVLAVHPLEVSDEHKLWWQKLTAHGNPVEVHHFDIENHAQSFNEGYDAAMAQHLATDPTIADEWLEQHDVVVRAAAIDAALNAAKQVADATAHLPAENAAVWDVIDRIQKLRPVDAPTEQDRAEAEADDEREGKAAARAEEVQNDGE